MAAKKWFGSAAAFGVVGVALLCGSVRAQPNPPGYKCDTNAVYNCNCVIIATWPQMTVCVNILTSSQLIYCSPNGQTTCQVNQVFTCPGGNASEAIGSCQANVYTGNSCTSGRYNSC
jgi:hypothetical protein